MKKVFLLLLLLPVLSYGAATDDAISVLNVLSQYGQNPKALTNPQMLSIVNRFNEAHGFSNPWSEEDNPAEFAAWPTNEERATFFLQRLGGEIRSRLALVAGREHDTSAKAARDAAVQAAQNEL